MDKMCSLEVAGLVGKKWTIPIISKVASHGKHGFNGILRGIEGLSPKLLSQRLKELEKIGILEKELITKEMPIRTKYRLTERGRELMGIIGELNLWNIKYSKKNFNPIDKISLKSQIKVAQHKSPYNAVNSPLNNF